MGHKDVEPYYVRGHEFSRTRNNLMPRGEDQCRYCGVTFLEVLNEQTCLGPVEKEAKQEADVFWLPKLIDDLFPERKELGFSEKIEGLLRELKRRRDQDS